MSTDTSGIVVFTNGHIMGNKDLGKSHFSTILQPSASNERHLNICMAWLNAAAMSLLCIYGNIFKFPSTSYTGVLVDSD